MSEEKTPVENPRPGVENNPQQIARHQMAALATSEAYSLLHEGSIALAEVESNGMRVDVGYIDRMMKKTRKRIDRIVNEELEPSEVVKLWRKTYGRATTLGSDTQLAHVLFDLMQFPVPRQTDSGRSSTDEEALEAIDHPFIPPFLKFKKLSKASNTFLKSIRREVTDGFIHCFFNLHKVLTYRSSSEAFNFQNLPVRDQEIADLIRQCFIPRDGRQIAEIDYSGAEVRVGACYHKDPVMIEYILDPTKDMHRDLAMECYLLAREEITKPIRHCGKNMFVFPQFYGDWYKDCAPALWAAMRKVPLITTSGELVWKHLASRGITDLGPCDFNQRPIRGTFEDHIRKVEENFWGKRFAVYAQWKKSWFSDYQETGAFQTLTGFVCQGLMKKNKVINYPVQGSAFHLLLWSLIRLVRKELPKHNMKTLIVGQIHDSMVADVVPEERDDFIALCDKVMTKSITRYAPWLVVPMEVEAEVSPVGASWAAKKPYKVT